MRTINAGIERITVIVTGATLYFGLLLGPVAAQVPVIFHATQTADIGDIIGLQGGNFGAAPQVWMQHVIGTEPALSPQVQLPVLNCSISNNYAASRIPLTETVGLYAIWVKNGANLSASNFVNQARAWGANDLAGTEIDSSRSFRLFGRNLFIPGGTPAVSFVNGATTLPATVTTNGSDENVLYVTAPAGLVAGTAYTVNVQNGLGGSYGQTALSYPLTGRAGGTDGFGLGVPWGADFTFYTNVYNVKTDSRLTLHAVGDGTNDDTPAITAAIAAANAAGGGVVYLPSGTYLGKTSLTMKSKVVLKGDGPTLSTWKCQSTNLMSGSAFWESGVSDVGLLNLCIYNTTKGYGYNSRTLNSSNVFVLNSTIRTDVGKNMYWGSTSHLVLKNSSFYSTQTTTSPGPLGEPVFIQGCSDEVFSGNTVEWYFCRALQDYCTRALIETNTFTRYVFGTNSSTESGGISIGQSDSLVLLNNTFDKSGSGPLAWNYNDGETILCQGGGSPPLVLFSFGTASSATATTLTDTTQSWTNNYALPVSSTPDHHYYIAIVAGPGAGQLRQVVSNTVTTVTIDSPWDIIPTSASEYAINPEGARRVLVKGNRLAGNPRGLEFYKVSTEDLSIINNTLTDNGAIWLWANWQPPWINVQMDTEVVGNYVGKSTNLYSINYPGSLTKIFAESSAGTNDPANKVFGTEFRLNTVEPMLPNIATNYEGEGFAAESDAVNNTNVGMLGVIFQGNLATNATTAYRVGTGDYATTLWDNSASNAVTLLMDNITSGNTVASMATLVGNTPPSPWFAQDVGPVIAVGNTSYTNGVFTQICSGADIQGTNDTCQFCYQPSSGDCSITALVAAIGTNNVAFSKVGVMIRGSLAAGAPEASTLARPSNGTNSMEFDYRTATNSATSDQNLASFTGPHWVRQTRVGNVFSAYYSTNGTAWTQLGTSVTINNMVSNACVGIVSTSHNNGAYAYFTISNVSVTP